MASEKTLSESEKMVVDSDMSIMYPKKHENMADRNQQSILFHEQQVQNTFLRERFLRMLTSISDRSTEITLTNGSRVLARFIASDVDVLNFQVADLRTPIGVLPTAILRTTDIGTFTISDCVDLLNNSSK